jgi:4-alpha-glucanotransferase
MTLTLPQLVPASYVDAHGTVRDLDAATRAVVSDLVVGDGVPASPVVCTPGEHSDRLHGDLETLDGTPLGPVVGTAPEAGYYRLHGSDGLSRLVISAPATFPQPERGWGWAVQLYAARSRESWGIGEFRDLARIARSAQAAGAGSVLISPVHAAAPIVPQQASPYSPSSRQWLQLLHIAVEDVPGAADVDLADLAERGRALNADRLIRRDTVWEIKRTALERIWAATRDRLPAEHDAWSAAGGPDLQRFATWCVLAEQIGHANWRSWPEQYRTPAGAVGFAADHADRVAFYCWAQWLADVQFDRACRAGVTVVADVAVGFDSSSADAWVHQDLVCFDFEVGCPPDTHNLEGQKWGLPAMSPTGLVGADLGPFIAMVRSALAHAGALRIDHVMQLWRLYWVPLGGHAAAGVYVNYPTEALLAILRLEAHRSGAWVVGEDMGTVAEGVRDTMAEHGMLGYRAALRVPVDQFPEGVMGASSTHDQATVAGTLTGSDVEDLRRIGKAADFAQLARVRQELATAAGVDLSRPVGPEEVARAVRAQYSRLSACAARVVLASLDDAGAVAERPNMPGTVTTWPNWCLSLPLPVEDLLDAPLAREVAAILDARRAHDLAA